MRVGVSGLGTIGSRHLATLHAIDGAQVVAAADPRAERRNGITVPTFTSFEEMLGEVPLDVVLLCTPSWLHAEQGIMAAERGIHVVSEKPLAITLTGADEVVEACRRNGARLAVLHQYRFHPALVMLKQALDRGELGDLVFVNVSFFWRRDQAYYDKDGGWRGTWLGDGGGALMNQGSHAVDLARWLGGPIATVTALTANVTFAIEAEDTVTAAVTYANGGLGTIQVTTCAATNHPAVVHVQGTAGWATASGQTLSLNGSEIVVDDGAATPHYTQLVEILRSITAGTQPPVAGEDARQTLADTLAIYEAASTGRTVDCGPTSGLVSTP